MHSAGLRRELDVEHRHAERRGVEHRAGRGDPRAVRVRRTEERERRRATCASPDSSVNHAIQLSQTSSMSFRSPVRCARVEHLPRRRRRPGADREIGDRDLAARERAVDRRQVRDHSASSPSPIAASTNAEQHPGVLGRPFEAEREQRRTARGERVAPAVVLEPEERDGEAARRSRSARRSATRATRSARTAPSPGRVARSPRRPREQPEAPPAPRGTRRTVKHDRRAARDDEGADRGIEHERPRSRARRARSSTSTNDVTVHSSDRGRPAAVALALALLALLVDAGSRSSRATGASRTARSARRAAPAAMRLRSRSSASSRFWCCERRSDASPARPDRAARAAAPVAAGRATASRDVEADLDLACSTCSRAGRPDRPTPVNRHSSSSSGMTHDRLTRNPSTCGD